MEKLTTRGKIFFSLLALIILIVGFTLPSFFKADVPNTEEPETPDEPDSTETEQVEVAESNYPGLHLEIQTADTDTYHYAIHSLTTDSEPLTETIQTWLTNKKETFIANVKEFANSERPADLNIAFEMLPLSETMYNIIFNVYEINGGANGISEAKTFVINIAEDKMYTLYDFLHIENENHTAFQELIRNKLNADENLQQNLREDALTDSLKQIDQLQWTITKDALTIYWDKYEIAIGAVGNIQIEVPLAEIEHLLTTTAHDILQIEVVEEPETSVEQEEQEPEEPEDQEPSGEIATVPTPPPSAGPQVDGKYVAITFDDGPHPKVTGQVLETLRTFNAKATFFMLGNQVDFYPNLVQQVAQEGHEVGTHSQTHADLTVIGQDQLQNEFAFTNERIKDIIGYYPTQFRPPYGAYNSSVINQAVNYGQKIIMWSVDSLDWQSQDPVAINQMVTSQTVPGSIILLHDIHDATAQALPTILTNLQNQDYTFVTVSQLLELQGATGVGPHFGNYK